MTLSLNRAVNDAVAAVVIGRNEGDRLIRCLRSVRSQIECVVYVDSGSTDGSVQAAKQHGAHVVPLNPVRPFTAARARNEGFAAVRVLRPEIAFVQFIDGDCELVSGWLGGAKELLERQADIGAVCGRRRERFPEMTVYNWLCDREWDGPTGEVRAFGGDVLIRAAAFEAVGGYREDVIAAEDDELGVRLRAAGWRIWRVRSEMTTHDAAIRHFSQWWRRSMRCGYAYANGAYLHGARPERHFVWQSRRALLWGLWLPLGCLATTLTLSPWGAGVWLIFPLQVARQTLRNSGAPRERATLAMFQMMARFPEALGQLKFARDLLFSRRGWLIEYK